MPAFILPQVLLCGLLIPRDQMAAGLQAIADVLPLSFAYDPLHDVSIDGADLAGVATEVLVLVAMVLVAIALAALTLRRRTA
jgi:ABC-2 type transport system permease protein